MRRQRVVLLTVGLLLAGVTAVAAQEQMSQGSGPVVAEATLTTGVLDRQPVDNLTTVDADVRRIYLWTRVVGAEGEVQLEHVWYRGDDEMARVPLRISGSNWRTWSSKNIEPSWTGEWRVEVVGPDGTVLETVKFVCT